MLPARTPETGHLPCRRVRGRGHGRAYQLHESKPLAYIFVVGFFHYARRRPHVVQPERLGRRRSSVAQVDLSANHHARTAADEATAPSRQPQRRRLLSPHRHHSLLAA